MAERGGRKMKTAPMEHQREGQRLLDGNPEYYALGAEQGTGKTWMLLNDAERQWTAGRITGVLVVAPNGVHTNWIRREIPTHLSVPVRTAAYRAAAGKREFAKVEALLRPDEDALTVLAINIDALNTKRGHETARKFVVAHRAMVIVDESSRIKNLKAGRTVRCIEIGEEATSRRIASGTMLTNGPMDLFAQFEFLKPRGKLLGTNSLRAFTAEYAEVLPESHGLVQHVKRGRNFTPQVIKRDRNGRPVWRNLDRLRNLMSPYVYRILKEDCLDLPEKIYTARYFDLAPAQAALYATVRDELIIELTAGRIDRMSALTAITKLRQITSGFVMIDGVPHPTGEDNPRLDLLLDAAQDIEGQFIVWATYQEEIAQVTEALQPLGPVVTYFGGTKGAAREAAVDDFQAGRARIFVGNPSAAGIGLTLTAATTAIYYSRSFSLEERLQSEDRCHRIGTRSNVLYIDLVAADTIDEKIAAALAHKEGIAAAVMDGRGILELLGAPF